MGKVYAQIYSLNRQKREGTLEVLKTIADIGYDGVELLSTFTDGKSVDEFKKYLSDLNLKVVSSGGYNTEQDLEFGQQLGLRYCTYGHVNIGRTREEVLAAADKINENGKIVSKYGIKLIIHNHANELMWLDNEKDNMRVYDLLIQSTDPDYVGFQFDVGWGQLAGAGCPAYIRKYAGRFPLIHVKESNKVAQTEEEYEHFPTHIFEFAKKLDPDFAKPGQPPRFPAEAEKMMYESRSWNVALGEGLIDWAALRDAAEAQGVEAYISEREYYHITGNSEGLSKKAAEIDYNFMRSIFG